jgi:hypothetical protein
LREERRTLTEELELERQERLEAQQRVKQLTREHPHLELERELKRITEELEQEGRLRNHRERQRLAEELEAERLAPKIGERSNACSERCRRWSRSWRGCGRNADQLLWAPRVCGGTCSAPTTVIRALSAGILAKSWAPALTFALIHPSA